MELLEHGLYFHIYNHGINSTKLFLKENDYEHFLLLFKKYIGPIADTFAYCLLSNHFYVLVRVKEKKKIGFLDSSKINSKTEKWKLIEHASSEANIEKNQKQPVPYRQFGHLFNVYATFINMKYNRTGSLFEKNFHRIKIDSTAYFKQLLCYIHLNSVKHCLVRNAKEYRWSSYPIYLSSETSLIKTEVLKNWFDGINDFIEFHKGFNSAEERIANLLID